MDLPIWGGAFLGYFPGFFRKPAKNVRGRGPDLGCEGVAISTVGKHHWKDTDTKGDNGAGQEGLVSQEATSLTVHVTHF